MTTIAPFTYIQQDLFSLKTFHHTKKTRLCFHTFTPTVTTRDLLETSSILQKNLPSIFSSTCFNDRGISFRQEVKTTELGHLFEHILLEHLCLIKIAKGHKEAIYKGRTRWNWNNDPVGTFHICLDVPFSEKELLYKALEESIFLMKKIMQSAYTAPSSLLLTLPTSHRTLSSRKQMD